MAELKVIKTCAERLETALWGVESRFGHFLNKEGFISDTDYDEVFDPKTLLSKEEKARKLVGLIRRRVNLDKNSYHTLVDWLEKNGEYYAPITNILQEEYKRQCAVVRPNCGKLHDQASTSSTLATL